MKQATVVKIFLVLITALSLLGAFVSPWVFALATGVCIFGWVMLWKRSRKA